MKNRNIIVIVAVCGMVIGIGSVLAAIQSSQNLQGQAASHSPLTVSLSPRGRVQTVQNNVSPVDLFTAPNDTIPPQVTITSPQAGAQFPSGSSVLISARATDNIAVSKVEFLANSKLLCSVTNLPYSCSWKVPPQHNYTYVIVARAYDSTGNLSSRSIVVRAW